MTTDARPGMIRFDGAATAFFVAICAQCDMVLPHESEAGRTKWAAEHARTGHSVSFALDVRPDPIVTDQRRASLVKRLREKYATVTMRPAGLCSTCKNAIVAGESMVSFNGFHHAQCLNNQAYLRLASITDIAPGIFNDAPPVSVKSWPSDPTYREIFTDVKPRESNPFARLQDHVTAVHKTITEAMSDPPPMKMNARERRRLKRKNKQWEEK